MSTETCYRAAVEIGKVYSVVMPWSECAMHMKIAGHVVDVLVTERGAYPDGGRGPHMTLGEAGIIDNDGQLTANFSVWAGHRAVA